MIFKLRFRVAGSQRVTYLGVDEHFVAQIQTELLQLQSAHHRSRELRRLEAEARQYLRDVKGRLAPQLEHAGFRYHGHSLRRPRQPSAR